MLLRRWTLTYLADHDLAGDAWDPEFGDGELSTPFFLHSSSLVQSAKHRNRLETKNKVAKPASPNKAEATAIVKENISAKKSTLHSMLLVNACTPAMSSNRAIFADFLNCACLLRNRRFLLVCRLPTAPTSRFLPPLLRRSLHPTYYSSVYASNPG